MYYDIEDMAVKKILFITYAWPPKGGVGVMRVLKFAKYLPQLGWMPVILTTDDNAPGSPSRNEDVGIDKKRYKTVRVAYEDRLSAFPVRLRRILLIPDTMIGWLRSAVEEGLKLLKEEKIDAIFSTSPPRTAHLIASELKKRSDLPWAADLRDLWSCDHFEKESFLRKYLFSLPMERKILKGADRVVTVSGEWALDLARTSGIAADKIRVITNGFDEEDYSDIPTDRSPRFTLAYTGKLHREMQDPEILFETLGDCVKENLIKRDKIDIRFYTLGFRKADILSLARKYGIADIVTECGPVDYKESLKIQRDASALLFFQWKGAKGWYSAKIFEYLGSKRPVIVISEEDSIVNKLVKDLDAGAIANSKEGLKSILLRYYNEHVEKGYIVSRVNEENLKNYTRLHGAKVLAGLLNELCR